MNDYVIALGIMIIVCVIQTAALAVELILTTKRKRTKIYTIVAKGKTFDHRLTKDEASTVSDIINQYKYETGDELFSFSEKIL